MTSTLIALGVTLLLGLLVFVFCWIASTPDPNAPKKPTQVELLARIQRDVEELTKLVR
ncbi:MAG: hypothetical protein HOP28_07515 [Gemmatimonadales bacterium]|nr:hypothetical protein [Gemmatimonadales bacterium]